MPCETQQNNVCKDEVEWHLHNKLIISQQKAMPARLTTITASD